MNTLPVVPSRRRLTIAWYTSDWYQAWAPGLGALHAGELDDDHARGLELAFQMQDLAVGREELDRGDEKLALEWRQCRPGGLHIPLHQPKVGHIVAGNDIRSHGRSLCLWPPGRQSLVGFTITRWAQTIWPKTSSSSGYGPPRMIVAHQQAATVLPLAGALRDEAVVRAYEQDARGCHSTFDRSTRTDQSSGKGGTIESPFTLLTRLLCRGCAG